MLSILIKALVALVALAALGAPTYEILAGPAKLWQPPPLFTVSQSQPASGGHSHSVVSFGGC